MPLSAGLFLFHGYNSPLPINPRIPDPQPPHTGCDTSSRSVSRIFLRKLFPYYPVLSVLSLIRNKRNSVPLYRMIQNGRKRRRLPWQPDMVMSGSNKNTATTSKTHDTRQTHRSRKNISYQYLIQPEHPGYPRFAGCIGHCLHRFATETIPQQYAIAHRACLYRFFFTLSNRQTALTVH